MKHSITGRIAAVVILCAALVLPAISHADFVVKDGGPLKHFGLKHLNPAPDAPVFVHTANYVDEDAEQPAKLLIISFWASWCKPCKKELPLLQKYYEKYKDQGLMVLAVSLDKDDDGIAGARAFAKEKGFSFPVLSDYRNLVARQYFDENVNLPAMLQIGPGGSILKAHNGYEEGFAQALEKDIRKALGLPEAVTAPKVEKKKKRKGKKAKRSAKKRRRGTKK